MSYLYSKLSETGVSPPIGTGGTCDPLRRVGNGSLHARCDIQLTPLLAVHRHQRTAHPEFKFLQERRHDTRLLLPVRLQQRSIQH